MEGWVTQQVGDRGIDFVGRLDVGSQDASTKLVVLGQAKCIVPTGSISAEYIARVVARLRRGWIGVYVTTGVFSVRAQEEIVDDEYPIVLINGRRLAEEVRLMAYEQHGGDLDKLIKQIVGEGTVAYRRPEEILFE